MAKPKPKGPKAPSLVALLKPYRGWIVLLIALAFAVCAGMFLARRMVVPIRTLQAGAARMGSGELDHRLTIKTGDELEALADQFNKSAAALEESHATLEQRVRDRTHELSESLEQQTARKGRMSCCARRTRGRLLQPKPESGPKAGY